MYGLGLAREQDSEARNPRLIVRGAGWDPCGRVAFPSGYPKFALCIVKYGSSDVSSFLDTSTPINWNLAEFRIARFAADLDVDDTVYVEDLIKMLNNLGQTSRPFVRGDINRDGVIDPSDVAGLIQDFGVAAGELVPNVSGDIVENPTVESLRRRPIGIVPQPPSGPGPYPWPGVHPTTVHRDRRPHRRPLLHHPHPLLLRHHRRVLS